ncbi:hypothetical protein DL93DRAFT_2165011 [Clavulina sp. PMI_390]|nr:hypothetical protein DL93DRAFT_2165011 [Clavulina sp. PMI_390]
MDNGFSAFVTLLSQNDNGIRQIPEDTLYASIAYYTHTLPVTHLPAFIRALITSPSLWNDRTWSHLIGTQAAVRQSFRLKLALLKKSVASSLIFGQDLASPLSQWVKALGEGLASGNTLGHLHASIAILSGVIGGLDDINQSASLVRLRHNMARLLTTTCAETLRFHVASARDQWGGEFAATASPYSRSLTVCLLARALPSVSNDYLPPLPLKHLIPLLQRELVACYQNGHYLDLAMSAERNLQGEATFRDLPAAQNALQQLHSSFIFSSAGALHQLLDRCTSVLIISEPALAWSFVSESAESFQNVAAAVEAAWLGSALSTVGQQSKIASNAAQPLALIWDTLKNLLFSCLISAQSHVNICAFHHHPSTFAVSRPIEVVSVTLRTLFHLSFISSHFGGSVADASGLPQQKRAFFGSLDILSTQPPACEALLSSLISLTQSTPPSLVRRSRSAFVLHCAEQLVPCVTDAFLQLSLVPFAQPFLTINTTRDTFESAHSVILAIFANNGSRERFAATSRDGRDKLSRTLAPLYLESLLQNLTDDGLSSDQLQLAFSSVVRSLCASGETELAWHCVDSFVQRLRAVRQAIPPRAKERERLERSLISSISATDTLLLPRLLHVVESEILAGGNMYPKEIAQQVLSGVGDAQKDIALGWWMRIREGIRHPAVHPTL